MHELYIAQCILNVVADSLPPDIPADSVSQVNVQVGRLDAVVPANLIFLFDVAKKSPNYGMPRASLNLKTVEAAGVCRDCNSPFTPELPIFLCPECGSGAVEITGGRGITLTGIEAET